MPQTRHQRASPNTQAVPSGDTAIDHTPKRLFAAMAVQSHTAIGPLAIFVEDLPPIGESPATGLSARNRHRETITALTAANFHHNSRFDLQVNLGRLVCYFAFIGDGAVATAATGNP